MMALAAVEPRGGTGNPESVSATVRPFTRRDVPAVTALFRRIFPASGWRSQGACEAYFRTVFFESPWRDPALPSWVAWDGSRVAGFLGVLTRPMRFRGRPIRAAVGTQFMVAPERRHSLIALQLIKAGLSGPQDISFTDGANEYSRRLWTGLGGAAPLFHSVHWTRPLRPARYGLDLLARAMHLPAPLVAAARPGACAVDALAARLRPNRFTEDDRGMSEQTLRPAAMAANLSALLHGCALQPEYDVQSLDWLLVEAAHKTRHGTLRARAVCDGAQRLAGWYLYYVLPGGVSEVLQIAARRGMAGGVLQRLLADAWRQGATALTGRLEPRFVQALSDRRCWFRQEGTWTLVHSRHRDILSAVHQGDAFLSRLDGEWWLRFHGG